MVRWTWMLLFAFAVGGCRKGDHPADASVPIAGQRAAELFFTTGLVGTIEPCGCTSRPLGGIQRLATVVGSSKLPHGLVDAGNLLFPAEGLSAATREQHLLKAQIIARTFRELGILAINLGEGDLTPGDGPLKNLQREGAVPFVSANVRPVAESGPAVAQSFLRELGGIAIGVTGVATPERFKRISDVTAIEYAPALRPEVEQLRKRGAEVIVVLAQIGDTAARELAAAIPEIDVILRGPGTPIGQEPIPAVRLGNAIIAEAGSQGQYVGRLEIVLGPGPIARPIAFDDAGYGQQRDRALIERRIEAMKREIARLEQDPIHSDVAARKSILAQLEERLRTQSGASARPNGSNLRIELVPLGTEVSGAAEITQLLTAYYAQLKDFNLGKGDLSLCAQKSPQAASFVGSDKCVDCHGSEYDFWQKTKHAAAWATLENQNKHFDLTCIGCHTIGYQQPGGYCRLADIGALKNVGCENCHGPGSKHVADQEPTSITLAVDETTCKQSCHVPQHSDRFDYATYMRQITGEGHEIKSKGQRGSKG